MQAALGNAWNNEVNTHSHVIIGARAHQIYGGAIFCSNTYADIKYCFN